MSETNYSWDRTKTGTVFHNFGVAHAECSKNVKVRRNLGGLGGRSREMAEESAAKPLGLTMCKRCVQLDDEANARIEASMEPVGEYDQACEGITGYGDAKAETSSLVGTIWQSKDFDNTTAEITSVGTDLSGNVIVVNYDRLTQVTEGYQSREAGDMSLDMFKLYFRPLAEEQADDETGHEGTVCGAQLYDPFRGLGFCDKREYHHYREGHRGNFDEILSAHAEAIEEDTQRTAAVDIDALHVEPVRGGSDALNRLAQFLAN